MSFSWKGVTLLGVQRRKSAPFPNFSFGYHVSFCECCELWKDHAGMVRWQWTWGDAVADLKSGWETRTMDQPAESSSPAESAGKRRPAYHPTGNADKVKSIEVKKGEMMLAFSTLWLSNRAKELQVQYYWNSENQVCRSKRRGQIYCSHGRGFFPL